MRRLLSWLPEDPRLRWGAVILLLFLLAERLLLVFGQPDLLHDLDAGELKHMDLALFGLPGAPTLQERLLIYLAGPENIHHGGYPSISAGFWLLSKVSGVSLQALRLLPIGATVLAAACMTAWLTRRSGGVAAVTFLVLMAAAPLLFLKWSCTSRGGHLEGIVFIPIFLLLLDRAIRSERSLPWLLAGVVGGFAVYFTYLSIAFVGVLSLGALIERRQHGPLPRALVALVLGGVIGFLPWILGLLVLDMPYLEATIHQSSNPDEAAQVHTRGVLGTVRATLSHLPHNLWPWTIDRADAPAYLSEFSDMLDYSPTPREWLVRAVILLACTLGIVAALSARSPLMLAVVLLPAVHHLFVVRLANPLAWPDIPHRYLVLVFPQVVASAGLGLAWLASGQGRLRKGLSLVLALALAAVSIQGLLLHSRWLSAPDAEALAAWDVATYRNAGLGQVRLHEGEQMNALLEQHQGEHVMEAWRGISLIFPASSDYYLLFRGPSASERPYPGQLFHEPDPLSTTDGQRRAVVQGAFDATVLRAGGDSGQLQEWLCRWDPVPSFVPHVEAVFAEGAPDLSCGR